MYKILAEGVSRYAEFMVDTQRNELKRTLLDISDKGTTSDLISFYIMDESSNSKMRESWMYLSGTKEEIVNLMANELPMARMETKAIFAHLDTVEGDDTKTAVLYPIEEPPSAILKNSPTFKTLRKSARSMVASMFNVAKESITVLSVNA